MARAPVVPDDPAVQCSCAFLLTESILRQLTDHDTRISIKRDPLRARCPDYSSQSFPRATPASRYAHVRRRRSCPRSRGGRCAAHPPARSPSSFDGQIALDGSAWQHMNYETSETARTHDAPCAFAAHLDCEPALIFSFPPPHHPATHRRASGGPVAFARVAFV